MNLQAKINKILNLDKFNNLSAQQKETIKECILANYLILSPKNQARYLDIIENNLIEIEDLGSNHFYENNICYDGIVQTRSGNEISENVFQNNFKLKYREYPTPMGRLTRSVLHEFGHLAVKNQFLNLNDSKTNENGELLLDLGGLVISESLRKSFGHGFSEVLNEFTTFLSFKSFLAYRPSNEVAQAKMKEFAQKRGLSIEEEKKDYLDILPDDLFTSYTETYLANEPQPEGTKEMFNPLYVKFTPLVKLIMRAFQNPTCTYQDLVNAFKNGEGLSATKDGKPINDLFYGYYESSFYTKSLFDSIMKEQISWEQFCNDFDEQLTLSTINKEFLNTSIDIFTKFYEKRIKVALNDGALTESMAHNQLEDFYRVSESCLNFYQYQNSMKK